MGQPFHLKILTLASAMLLGAQVAIHATRGVVKTVDDTTLVIVRFSHRGEMTFSLRASTKREGAITPGATVSVRYLEEGQMNVATAVALQQVDGPPRPNARHP
jgi:hypothetical protein